MKRTFLATAFLIIGVFAGILFSAVTLNISAGPMMIKEVRSPFDFDKTVSTVTERINAQPGWHVVALIDQDAEVQKHGGRPIGRFNIIQYCNGVSSSAMLATDDRKRIGAMMPKTFAVYEKTDGQVYLATANGAVMGKLFGGEIETMIEKVSLDVEGMLRFMNYRSTIF